jgi:hypothetical protein
MPYNRAELSAVGFKIRKVRREMEVLENAMEKNGPEDSQVAAYTRLDKQLRVLLNTYYTLLEKGRRER